LQAFIEERVDDEAYLPLLPFSLTWTETGCSLMTSCHFLNRALLAIAVFVQPSLLMCVIQCATQGTGRNGMAWPLFLSTRLGEPVGELGEKSSATTWQVKVTREGAKSKKKPQLSSQSNFKKAKLAMKGIEAMTHSSKS